LGNGDVVGVIVTCLSFLVLAIPFTIFSREDSKWHRCIHIGTRICDWYISSSASSPGGEVSHTNSTAVADWKSASSQPQCG